MIKHCALASLLFLVTHTICSVPTEWMYPVDHVMTQDGEKICIIHQKQEHLDLWLWDPVTHEAIKGLLSSYTPAGLVASPSRNEFCFIDNDRLYIKSVIKKGPCALDFMGPYELSKINWIDDQSFYFSAKERSHYNLFHGTTQGSLCRLTYSKEVDYLYPQKQGSSLFFIQRDKRHVHSIMLSPYPLQALERYETAWTQDVPFIEKLNLIAQEEAAIPTTCSFINPASIEQIYTHISAERALSFLHMESDTQGFFIEHAASINKKDLTVDFNYYELVKSENTWRTRLLFGFSIPVGLLFSFGDTVRLYESVYPLLPRTTPTRIYYVSDTQGSMDVFSYERATGTITQVSTTTSGYYYFVPYIYNNSCLCGGKLIRKYDAHEGLAEPTVKPSLHSIQIIQKTTFEIDENGFHTIQLATF